MTSGPENNEGSSGDARILGALQRFASSLEEGRGDAGEAAADAFAALGEWAENNPQFEQDWISRADKAARLGKFELARQICQDELDELMADSHAANRDVRRAFCTVA